MTDHIARLSWRKAVLGGVTAFLVLGISVGYMINRWRDAQPDHIDSDGISAIAISDKGQHEEAEKLFRDIWWQGDGDSRERTSNYLSAVLAVQGKLEEAGEFYEERRQYFREEGRGGATSSAHSNGP